MNEFVKTVEIRWSDLDPNFHLRHSVYYDWGAYSRMTFLISNELTPAVLQQEQLGPILFREECVFKKEIHFGDVISINVKLLRSSPDMSRWSMMHEIWKNGDTLCAIITVDGAWINTQLRKLGTPPAYFSTIFEKMPRAANFEWISK